MAKKANVEDLEIAINQFLETNDYSVFNKFVGNCNGSAPYGEEDLGDAVNSGDFNLVGKLLSKLSNFSTEWDDDLKESNEKEAELNDTSTRKEYYKVIEDVAKKHDKLVGGSDLAKSDKALYKAKEKDLAKDRKTQKDKDYLADKKKAIEDFKAKTESKNSTISNDKVELLTASVKNNGNGDNTNMEISKRDLTKIMSAMKTINEHFSENDETEDENEEVVDTRTIELPADVADAIREALDEGEEVAEDEDEVVEDETDDVSDDEDVDTDEDEDDDVEEDEDEDEEETEEFCGDSENFSMKEFYEFADAMTQTIENLNKKVEKISKSAMDEANSFIETFSMKDYRSFAESVTETLENITARVDALAASKKTKDEVTTNVDALKKTGDDMEQFITKSDEGTSVETVVENPEAGVIANAEVVPAQFSERYEEIKNFFSM